MEFLGVDVTKPSFLISMGSIAFNPLWWNITARYEHRSRFMTRLFCGSKYFACYVMAVLIFSLGIFRDQAYQRAIDDQPTFAVDDPMLAKALLAAAGVFGGVGLTLVLSSTYQLGITGTFLGDYFGILLKERVTAFPFSVAEHPMYYGSTLIFLATALFYRSVAGLMLTAWVAVVYAAAQQFEGPFTTEIYAQAAKASKAGEKAD